MVTERASIALTQKAVREEQQQFLQIIEAALAQKFAREQQQKILQPLEDALKKDCEDKFEQAVNGFLSLPSIVKFVRDLCRYNLKDNRGNWQGSTSDSSDLEQEVKLQFYLNINKLRSYNVDSVKSYLKQIVRSVCIDGFRHYSRERESTVVLEKNMDFAVPAAQFTEPQLQRAMESLKREDRKLLEMKFVQGYSIDQIAYKTGIDRSTVHYRLQRALKEIRKYFFKSRKDERDKQNELHQHRLAGRECY